MMNSKIAEMWGNEKLLNAKKTAFLCSEHYSSASVLKSYDWAMEQRKKGNCIISGFHSPLEQDVLEILLRGSQPIIMVLGRGMYKKPNQKISTQVQAGRLLVLTPFPRDKIYITQETAEIRNRLVLSIADSIVIGHMTKHGQIEKIIETIGDKNVAVLD